MRIAILLVLICYLTPLPSAYGRDSGINASGDGKYVLIQKDVGDARWAINLDLQNDYRLTGNVFSSSAPPVFVDCAVEQIERNGSERLRDWVFTYRCSLTDSCNERSCPGWATIDDVVVLPGTFFTTTPEPQPTAARTSTPIATTTPKPTAQSTPVVTSSLAGMIGTWDFTFTLSSTFTFTYRMQQLVTANGKTALATLNELGERQFVFRVQDLQPGSSLPYEFVMISNESGIICNYYVWNRSGNIASGLNFPLLTSNGTCDIETLVNGYGMQGVRTASTAVASGLESFGAPLTDVIAGRAERLRSEVAPTVSGTNVDARGAIAEIGALAIQAMESQ